MTILATLPRAVRADGTYTVPSLSIPVGVTTLAFTINRFAWAGTNSDVVASGFLEYSLDNGVTWPGRVAITIGGGQIVYKGNPDAPSGFTFQVPDPTNTQRKVRGSITLDAPAPATTLDASVVVEGF